MKLCPFAWVINDAAPLPFVPFKRASHPRDAAATASFIFLRSLYGLLSCLEEAAVTAQFSQCLSDCQRKHHIPAQVEEEVLPGTHHSPSPLSVIPIELVHVSHSPIREESGSSGAAQFCFVLGFFAERTSHHLRNDAICMHHPTQISVTVGLPSP